jgi:DNA-binding phage protein
MSKRSQDWNEGLSQDLQDPKFAREFLLAAIEEGVPLQAALSKAIKAYGIAEFAKKVKIASPNLLRAVNPKHNPTQETLNKLLKPFGLQLTVAPIAATRHRKAG